MKIVSNTSPIIGLAKIRQLSLLKNLAEEVVIPRIVYRELLGKIGSEATEIDQAINDFILIRELPPLEPQIEIAMASLDEGEKQAIGLASTFTEKVILLLDDRAGRRVAKNLGIPTVGLIGLLVRAKQEKLIESVGLLVEELRNQGYWISEKIVEVAKKLAGEE